MSSDRETPAEGRAGGEGEGARVAELAAEVDGLKQEVRELRQAQRGNEAALVALGSLAAPRAAGSTDRLDRLQRALDEARDDLPGAVYDAIRDAVGRARLPPPTGAPALPGPGAGPLSFGGAAGAGPLGALLGGPPAGLSFGASFAVAPGGSLGGPARHTPGRRCVRCDSRCDSAALSVSRSSAVEVVFVDDHSALPSAGVCATCVAACEADGTPLLSGGEVADRVASMRASADGVRPRSPSACAGLQFPVGVVHRLLTDAMAEQGLEVGVSEEAATFLAAVGEYLVAEVLELSGYDVVRSANGSAMFGDENRLIVPSNVVAAVANDEELGTYFQLRGKRGREDDSAEAEAADNAPAKRARSDVDDDGGSTESAVQQQPTLLVASRRGNVAAVREWLRFVRARAAEFPNGVVNYQRLSFGDLWDKDGLTNFPVDHSCVTPVEAAVEGGHGEVVLLLSEAGVRLESLPPAAQALLEAHAARVATASHLPGVLVDMVHAYANGTTNAARRLEPLSTAVVSASALPPGLDARLQLPGDATCRVSVLLDGDDAVSSPESGLGDRLLVAVQRVDTTLNTVHGELELVDGGTAYPVHVAEALPPFAPVANVRPDGHAELAEPRDTTADPRAFLGVQRLAGLASNPFTSPVYFSEQRESHSSSDGTTGRSAVDFRGTRFGSVAGLDTCGLDTGAARLRVRLRDGTRVEIDCTPGLTEWPVNVV